MKNQLFALSLLFAIILGIGLVTLSGTILLVATPLLVFLLGSWLFRPPAPVLEVRRQLATGRANPGDPVVIHLFVRNDGDALNEVVIRDHVPRGVRVVAGSPVARTSMPAGTELEISYTVNGTRGSYRFDETTIEIAGLFPLRPRVMRFSEEHELVMLPNHRALSKMPIAPRRTLVYAGTNPASTGGEGTEFFDVREHRAGESLRRVNWRASARTPERLFVNEFQQERVADVAIILDCRLRAYPATDRAELFDASATAAASLADAILDSGNRVGFLGYGLSIDWLSPGFGRIQKHRVLNRIARSRLGESHVFQRLEAIPERIFPPGSQVILVTPLLGSDPVDIERLIHHGYAVMVVSPNPLPAQIPDRLAPSEHAAARILTAQRSVLLRRLRHAGIAVVDWDTSLSFEEAIGRSLGSIVAVWRRRRV